MNKKGMKITSTGVSHRSIMTSSSSSADELQTHLQQISDEVDRVVVEGSRAHNQATKAAETAAAAVNAEAESSGSFKVPVSFYTSNPPGII